MSLVELLVALAAFGVLGAIALRGLVTSVRWTERGIASAERDTQLAAAMETGEALLAATSPGEGDLVRMADSAVVWWATIAAGPVCATAGQVSVASDTRNDGLRLGGANTSPQPGDALDVFDDGVAPHPLDDSWTRHVVSSARWSAGGCGASPLLDPVLDRGFGAWVLHVTPPVDSQRLGSPTRLLRPMRFALYRSGPEWAAGLAEQGPSGPWTAIQPVASPLDPPGSGLHLTWLDTAMVAYAALPAAMRIRVAGPTAIPLRSASGAATMGDSMQRFLFLRNRR
jgi:type II secretory pathway pseudopilin PulG